MSSKIEKKDEFSLENISKPALQRLLRRAGVKRISHYIYDKMRSVMKDYLISIMREMIIFTEYNRRKTIQIEDLILSLEMRGIFLAAGSNPNTKKIKSIQSCNSKGKSGPIKKSKNKEEKTGENNPKRKQHRFRPGTKALRDIRYQQKNSDCLAIPKANFSKLVRNIYPEYVTKNLRFSAEVLLFLQLVIEDFLINLCSNAYNCSLFAGRDTIYPKDIDLVISIRKDI